MKIESDTSYEDELPVPLTVETDDDDSKYEEDCKCPEVDSLDCISGKFDTKTTRNVLKLIIL